MGQPVDINRLKAMLSGAKAVMDKVEGGDYGTGHIDPRALTESGVESVAKEKSGGVSINPQVRNNQPYYPNIEKSKLPDSIKKAMMENHIPQVSGLPQAFTLDEVMGYENDEKEVPYPSKPRTTPRTAPKPIVENIQSKTKTNISEDYIRKVIREEMRNVVQDEMIEFFTKYFAKSLAEDTQKKLIQHLVKEGRLTVKKK